SIYRPELSRSVRVDGSGRLEPRETPCYRFHPHRYRCSPRSDKTILARILVIAADALIRGTLRTMLQLKGHEVELAPHGEEARRRFREQAADLVICDITIREGR